MRFVKMQGIGNDYVYVEALARGVDDPPALARRMSDRHFGVGADGLILIRQPRSADAACRMEMYNADGSRGAMCGNGLRCVVKYVCDRGIATGSEVRVDTDAGTKVARVVQREGGKVVGVEVDMGAPRLERAAVPVADGGPPDRPAAGVEIDVGERVFAATALSMGNPHAVVRIVEDPEDFALEVWGPRLERHEWFPDRVNAEFARPRNRREVDVRVWERGSGETLACGTGACAVAVAGALEGWLDEEVTVHLRGGDLQVRWDRRGDGRVRMSGPAEEVFTGEWPG